MISTKVSRVTGLVAGVIASTMMSATVTLAQDYKLTFSTYLPPSYEYVVAPIQAFADRVAERTEGRVEIEIFDSGQLFSGSEELGAVERGDIDMSAPMDIYYTGLIPELGVSSLPFMWDSPESLQATIDAGLWDLGIKQKLEDHNLVLLSVAVNGPYQVYSNGFAVTSPADIKGKKWAVSGSTASKAVELMEGAPTTMSSGELYLALQRGTIDGTTRPFLTGLGRQLYEVADNLTITNLSYFTNFLVVNKDSWDELPEEIQVIITEEADKRGAEQLEYLNAYLAEAVTKQKDAGMTVNTLDDSQRAAFQDAVAPLYDWWEGQVENGAEMVQFARENK
ncbi:TRAP transporter substrate-binding protein [Roseovarius indicus]|uniref:TRAP transporter substrate-binding protein n=1 Tax=Roseovarius indicus TaxID=540747 RepID=UPI0007D8D112|nr:TRAP transporter substrate-binding protein [Roseovarius indicus]OAN98508.1 hypothetical protein A8B76_00175 [Roseovarius indicus]